MVEREEEIKLSDEECRQVKEHSFSMKIYYEDKNWTLLKTTEEISRFVHKVHHSYKHIADQSSLIFNDPFLKVLEFSSINGYILKDSPWEPTGEVILKVNYFIMRNYKEFSTNECDETNPLFFNKPKKAETLKNFISRYQKKFKYLDQVYKLVLLNSKHNASHKDLSQVKESHTRPNALSRFTLKLIKKIIDLKFYYKLLAEYLKEHAILLKISDGYKLDKIDKAKEKFMKDNKNLINLYNTFKKLLLTFHEFIEYSKINVNNASDIKLKEGYIYKRTGGKSGVNQQFLYICKYFRRLQKRWMCITDLGVGYLGSLDSKSCQNMLYFNQSFMMVDSEEETSYKDAIMIQTTKEQFLFHTGSIDKKNEWAEAIREAYEKYIESHGDNLVYDTSISYPPRPNNKAKFYIDAEYYFEDIYTALNKARFRILITDWWFCPNLHLKRPPVKGDSEIIKIFEKVVQKNPKIEIYVHMYKEPEVAMNLGSADSKTMLENNEKIKNNIKVFRHPERGISGLKVENSHHEKICVIDDKVAFFGGIDLCYGRFDTKRHEITDRVPSLFQGPDYCNPRINETIYMGCSESHQDSNEKQAEHANSDSSLLKNLWEQVKSNSHLKHHEIQWDKIGKLKKEVFTKVPWHDIEQLDRASCPRMPWHDIGIRIEGPSAGDVSLHYMELISWVFTDSANFKRQKNRYVLSNRITEDRMSGGRNRINSSRLYPLLESLPSENFNGSFSSENLTEEDVEIQEPTCECQILRSVGPWSYGVFEVERSILNTYIRLIRESKHFIYIENQFFISSTAGPDVENTIAQELVNRIIQAHESGEKFKVIVCMPLLPAFQGEVTRSSAPVLKIQLYWEHMTIIRSKTSIHESLKAKGIRPENYINFYGLRNHGVLKDMPVTEIVYIHSKAMIVDDDIAIIGSANINDRSMLGDRDSEIACCVNDNKKIDSVLAGKPFPKGKFAFEMRKRIFDEFVGNDDRRDRNLELVDLEDPLSEKFWKEFERTAEKNTELYFEMFRCYPDDSFKSFKDLERSKIESSDETIQMYRKKLYWDKKDLIFGFIVRFPLKFLCEEDLRPSIASKEGIAPTKVWV